MEHTSGAAQCPLISHHSVLACSGLHLQTPLGHLQVKTVTVLGCSQLSVVPFYPHLHNTPPHGGPHG